MTNPITEPTQSIRDRLVSALKADLGRQMNAKPLPGPGHSDDWSATASFGSIELTECIDAILAELQEPSGDACIAGARTQNHFTDNSAFVVFRAMIQHIRDGGK